MENEGIISLMHVVFLLIPIYGTFHFSLISYMVAVVSLFPHFGNKYQFTMECSIFQKSFRFDLRKTEVRRCASYQHYFKRLAQSIIKKNQLPYKI